MQNLNLSCFRCDRYSSILLARGINLACPNIYIGWNKKPILYFSMDITLNTKAYNNLDYHNNNQRIRKYYKAYSHKDMTIL